MRSNAVGKTLPPRFDRARRAAVGKRGMGGLGSMPGAGGATPGGLPGLPGAGGAAPFNLPPGFDKFMKK